VKELRKLRNDARPGSAGGLNRRGKDPHSRIRRGFAAWCGMARRIASKEILRSVAPEDLVQEALIRIAKARLGFEGQTSGSVGRFLRFVVADHARRVRVANAAVTNAAATLRSGSDTLADLERREVEKDIASRMRRRGLDQLDVVIVRLLIHDFRQREIAERLDISFSTVRQRLSRMRRVFLASDLVHP